MAGGKRRHAPKRAHTDSEEPVVETTAESKPAVDKKVVANNMWATLKKFANTKTATALLLLIPILLTIVFRLYPVWLPVTDAWAEQSMTQSIRAQVANSPEIQQLRQNFPNLPAERINEQVNELSAQYIEQNKDAIQAEQDRLSQSFKDRLQLTLTKPDGTTYGQTYMLAIDPYFFLRRAENIIDHGTICDSGEGACRDDHILAPHGSEISPVTELHSYVEAALAGIAGWFGYAPITGAFYLPPLIAAIAIIFAFLIVAPRYGRFAGLIAATVIGLHTVFLGRTPAGFVDTDIWNMLFPLLIAWIVIAALSRKDKWQYALAGGAALATAIYPRFWDGWFFAFFMFMLVYIGTTLFSFARFMVGKFFTQTGINVKEQLKEVKRTGIQTGIYILAVGVLMGLFGRFQQYLGAFIKPLQATQNLQDPINANLWPNVLTTVAELNTVNLATIVGQLGGRLLFVAAMLGIFAYAAHKHKKDWRYWTAAGTVVVYYAIMSSRDALTMNPFVYLTLLSLPLIGILLLNLLTKQSSDIHTELFLMGWMLASIFATTQGTRFLILTIPIYGIAIGFMTGWLVQAARDLAKKEIKIPGWIGSVAAMILVLVILFTPVHANMLNRAHSVGLGEVPSMNDAWWESLSAIRADSQPDAIVTSWWDFGHWFKYIADRRVNFDGGSQNHPNAHWVGKIMQSSDEQESLAILRMINCGANDAYERVNEHMQNTRASYFIVRETIMLPQEDAIAHLVAYNIPEEDARSIVEEDTHCTPPESYVIASEDMVGKAGVWGHFATWDFDKAFVYNAYKSYRRDEAINVISRELEIEEADATRLYGQVASLQTDNQQQSRSDTNAWISPWPGFVGARGCSTNNGTVRCDIGFSLQTQQGVVQANRVEFHEDAIENATIYLTAQGQDVGTIRPNILSYEGETYNIGGEFNLAIRIENNRAVIADQLLANSLFARLFYDENPGNYMTTLIKTQQITGAKIIIYKVDWEAYIEDMEQ